MTYAPEQGLYAFFRDSMDAYGGHHNRRMLRKLATEKPGTDAKKKTTR
jgi:hypothetical protein